jgi:hypothetical protein
LYEWLAKSEFSKIGGASILTKIKIEGEQEELLLLRLKKKTRKALNDFMLETVAKESAHFLKTWNKPTPIDDFDLAIYNLEKLLELQRCIQNEEYLYLQRI